MMSFEQWPPVALASVIAALTVAISSISIAYTASLRDGRKRRGEIAVEITRLLVDPELSIGARRRFAVGVVKVQIEPHSPFKHKGCILFIPLNSRVTMGRDESNDLSLSDTRVSRFHCGLVSEGAKVYLEEYCSVNGVFVNGLEVPQGKSRRLRDGDIISLAGYALRFQNVHCSSLIK